MLASVLGNVCKQSRVLTGRVIKLEGRRMKQGMRELALNKLTTSPIHTVEKSLALPYMCM